MQLIPSYQFPPVRLSLAGCVYDYAATAFISKSLSRRISTRSAAKRRPDLRARVRARPKICAPLAMQIIAKTSGAADRQTAGKKPTQFHLCEISRYVSDRPLRVNMSYARQFICDGTADARSASVAGQTELLPTNCHVRWLAEQGRGQRG